MRHQSVVIPVILASLMAAACDNGDTPDVPRTVPPTQKSNVTSIDVPAIAAPSAKPSKRIIRGEGPVYET
jgi:hypothetical protein